MTMRSRVVQVVAEIRCTTHVAGVNGVARRTVREVVLEGVAAAEQRCVLACRMGWQGLWGWTEWLV